MLSYAKPIKCGRVDLSATVVRALGHPFSNRAGMTVGGPVGPLDGDQVTSFGMDASNRTHFIKPFANLIATCGYGFTKDIGKPKIESLCLSRVLCFRKCSPDGVRLAVQGNVIVIKSPGGVLRA